VCSPSTSVVGVLALAAGVQGFGVRRLALVERILCLSAAGLLFWGGWVTDAVGIGLFGLVALTQLFRNAAPRAASEPKTGA